ncbi:MAG TPA: hypothetical protein VEB19_10720 [Gemmatimonadaceae bacterium]|nr:hypothetical protein [Gemmatimonadaceae bacterium]
MMTTEETAAPLPGLNDVTDAQWAALAQRQIFFGHQSVGGNIMQGVAEVLSGNPRVRLNVVESRALGDSAQPAFRHALVGRNDFPIEKFDDFTEIASTGFGPDGGVAMLKLCYIDIHTHTDAEDLFAQYQRRVAELRSTNPALTIVHFTSPLTTIENWKGQLRARLTGNNTQRDRNVVRHRYNELMRRAYEGREPLFDIARLEARLPDGRSVFYRAGSEHVPLLAPAYTDDGGHLNAQARRMVAEQLLIMLARLEPPRSTIAAKGS